MRAVAAVRPSDVDLPLFLHVAGAMALLGLLAAAALALLRAWRTDDGQAVLSLTRFGLWTLVAGVLPAWILMRVGAQWTYSREGWGDAENEPAWLDVGYVTADLGGAVLVAAALVAVVTLRRLRRTDAQPGLVRAAGVVAALLVVTYVVAIWAMTTKPN